MTGFWESSCRLVSNEVAIDELVVTRSQLLHLPNYHYPAIGG
jgi:hypothetical protein